MEFGWISRDLVTDQISAHRLAHWFVSENNAKEQTRMIMIDTCAKQQI